MSKNTQNKDWETETAAFYQELKHQAKKYMTQKSWRFSIKALTTEQKPTQMCTLCVGYQHHIPA